MLEGVEEAQEESTWYTEGAKNREDISQRHKRFFVVVGNSCPVLDAQSSKGSAYTVWPCFAIHGNFQFIWANLQQH